MDLNSLPLYSISFYFVKYKNTNIKNVRLSIDYVKTIDEKKFIFKEIATIVSFLFLSFFSLVDNKACSDETWIGTMTVPAANANRLHDVNRASNAKIMSTVTDRVHRSIIG